MLVEQYTVKEKLFDLLDMVCIVMFCLASCVYFLDFVSLILLSIDISLVQVVLDIS